MNPSDLITEIEQLETHCRKFEQKYGVSSEAFYELYREGKLEEGDIDEREDFAEWAGLYKVLLSRRERFQQLSRQRIHKQTRDNKVGLHAVTTGRTI